MLFTTAVFQSKTSTLIVRTTMVLPAICENGTGLRLLIQPSLA